MDQEEYQHHREGECQRADCIPRVLISLQMGKFSSDRAILNYAEEYWVRDLIPSQDLILTVSKIQNIESMKV